MTRKRGKGYYRRNPDGPGYICPACNQVYQGPFARKQAIDCCQDSKPLSESGLRAAESILESAWHIDTPRTKKPGDGEYHKDRWGHWRRGKKKHDPAQVRAEYNKAFEDIVQQMEAQQLADLDALYYSVDDLIDDWLTKYHGERSLEQKLASAWHYANFNLLKTYVYDAIRDAVRSRERFLINNPEQFRLLNASDDSEANELNISDWIENYKNTKRKGGQNDNQNDYTSGQDQP